jgi:TRAP-type C4-dicarboxylate transport system permease small subunit
MRIAQRKIEENRLTMKPDGMRGLLLRIDEVAGKLEAATRITCVALGGIMVAVVISGVIARYIMRNPMVWTEEVARALMIWTAFGGISIAVRQRSHLGVTLLVVRLPISLQYVVKLLGDGLSMWFLYILTVYGFRMVETGNAQIETATGISMSYFFICVPLCGLLTMVQLGVVMLNDLARWRSPVSPYTKRSNAQNSYNV